MRVIITGIFLFCYLPLSGQTFTLQKSQVSFYSSAPVEDIEAVSTKTRSLFNVKTGEVAFVIPIKSFEFRKKLMQEHFNEKFMESHQYPEATFTGKLTGYDREQNGSQKAIAIGKMNIHGVIHEIETEGTIEFGSEEIKIAADFPIKVADYDIEIPTILFYNIAEEVEVTINGTYKPHETN